MMPVFQSKNGPKKERTSAFRSFLVHKLWGMCEYAFSRHPFASPRQRPELNGLCWPCQTEPPAAPLR